MMVESTKLSFSPMIESDARQIVCWRYPPPYDIYNLTDGEEAILYALDPKNRFFAIVDEREELVGFCSFGQDAQVPGGDYGIDALDIGLGIHPDLTGCGRGIHYVERVLEFAKQKFVPPKFRVTIAAFNKRAQKVWRKAGFHVVERFQHAKSGRWFVMMVCTAIDTD